MPVCLAVDGGGTGCRVAAVCRDRVHRVDVGAANVTTSFDGALTEIERGIQMLAAELNQDANAWRGVPVYLGLAGVTDADVAHQVSSALPFLQVRVEDDRPAAVRGALGKQDGAVLHCGTGSFQAVQSQGRIRSVGGWGAVLSDIASAAWLGREALTVALDAHDRLCAGTPLTEALLAQFEGPSGVVVFARDASPRDFGALAPDVTRAAEASDVQAVALMQRAADTVAAVLTRLAWTETTPVVLSGSVAPQYEPFLPHAVRRAVQPARGSALDGAVDLAVAWVRETP